MKNNTTAPPRLFTLSVEDHQVPVALWQPAARCKGLVLACHGGSGHKESNGIHMIVSQLQPRGYAVAAIDGPVHGERRSDGSRDPAQMRADFREAWRAHVGRREMVADWVATLDHLSTLDSLAQLPVGYIGVSMGTAYGLPFLATESRVRAAVVGLWSASHVASHHLLIAARQVRCATWFTQCWDDEIFDRAGTIDLFDALGTSDKRLVVYPGRHAELSGERLDDAIAFLAGRLARDADLPPTAP
jgi:alpha-beta hydrolase superfamily lysophospholipase